MPAPALNVMIGIVSHTRRPDFAMLMSVFDTLTSLKMRGHDVGLSLHQGDADLGAARNLLFGNAYVGGYSHLLCVDADMSWPSGSIDRMLGWNVPLIAAPYLKKQDGAGYTVRTKEGVREFVDPHTGKFRADGLLRVEGMPTGLMLIRRDCIEAMIKLNAERWYADARVQGGRAWDVFRFVVREHKRTSEDIFFCEQYRSVGGEVWCDPHIKTTHHGDKGYVADYAAHMQAVFAEMQARA